MSLSRRLSSLLDPAFRDDILGTVFLWLLEPEPPTPDAPEAYLSLIKKCIIDPLDRFLEEEREKVKGDFIEGPYGWDEVEGSEPHPVYAWKRLAAVIAAAKFREAVEELVSPYNHCPPMDSETMKRRISTIEKHWKEFQVQMGWESIWQVKQSTQLRSKGGKKSSKPRVEKAEAEHKRIKKCAAEIREEALALGRGEPSTAQLINILRKKHNVTLGKTQLYEICKDALK